MRRYGRLCGAGRVIGRTAVLVLCVGLLGTPIRAEELADKVTIAVFGDSQAQGLAGGLQRILIEDPRYRVLNRSHPGAALVHNGSEWLSPVERFASRDPHRYLSLIESSATSASMMETIQKRTMIFGSAHPCSSKW